MVWSKLKKRVEERIAPELELELHLTTIRAQGAEPARSELRFVSKGFVHWRGVNERGSSESGWSELLEDWLQRPVDAVLESGRCAEAESLEALLLVIDRRVGKRRLRELSFPEKSTAWRFLMKRI